MTRALHSLACAKYKILSKSPEGKTISQQDSFSVNWAFTDKMRRIKVPLPPVDEKKKVMEDVDKDRKHTIDAAIVRWMKSRKVVQHQQLVMEVSNQLKHFQPDFKARTTRTHSAPLCRAVRACGMSVLSKCGCSGASCSRCFAGLTDVKPAPPRCLRRSATGDQEAHRGPHRQGVPGARQGQPQHLCVSFHRFTTATHRPRFTVSRPIPRCRGPRLVCSQRLACCPRLVGCSASLRLKFVHTERD